MSQAFSLVKLQTNLTFLTNLIGRLDLTRFSYGDSSGDRTRALLRVALNMSYDLIRNEF
jgi:hypothetical protein